MRHIDLFSGIGGFALAARCLGWHTIGFCELDPWAQRVLAKNFPGVPIHDDIHTLDGELVQQWGGADVLTGGFPCQPYSVAGKQRGAADDRALWPEMRRVIAEVRPTWVLGENVPGIVKMELDTVLADLEAEGYTCWPLIVPAVAVDAPHRRDRVWVVAHDDSHRRDDDGAWQEGSEGSEGQTLNSALTSSQLRSHPSRQLARDGRPTGQHLPCSHASEYVANPDSERLPITKPEPGEERSGRARVRTRPSSSCRWEVEPRVGRVVDGLPGRVDRLRGLGNAIVPQVAYEIMRLMS